MDCPICGRIYCDHTPEERGQSHKEMLADMQADFERARPVAAENSATLDKNKTPKRKKKVTRKK